MSHMSGEPQLPIRAPRDRAPALVSREWIAPLPPEAQPGAPKLQDYANIFIRRRRTILVSLVAVFGASLLLSAITPRAYEATAVLLISQPSDARQSSRPADGSGTTSDMSAMGSPTMETHVQLLQGESLAVQTALWLQKSGGPEVTPNLLRRALSARAVRDTQLIRVSARAGGAEQAQAIANAAASAYVSMNRRRARGYSETTSRYLSEQLVIARQNLSKAEREVRRFKESTGTIAPDASASDVLARVAGLESDSGKTAADLAQAKARLNQVRGQLSQQNRSIGSGRVRDDAVIQDLRKKLADLQSQRLDAEERYTAAFPEPVARIDEQIRATKRQLEQEIGHVVRSQGAGGGDLALQQSLTAKLVEGEAEVSALGARHDEVLGELRQTKARLGQIPAQQLQLSDLQRKLDVAEKVYSELLTRSQEVEVGRVMALGNADVAEPASRPRLPVKPNVPMNLALGLLLGLSLGIGIALAQDQLDDTLRDEKEAARLAEAPVLGTIPVFAAAEAPSLPSGGSPGVALEAYRALRYCLDFATTGRHGRVVLVTSAGPAEGKTTTVLNLAATVALSGRRVVLIDADLRRSGLRRMLEVEEETGLADVLLGEAQLEEVLRTSERPRLSFITAGRQTPNPTELLEGPRMRALIEEVRQTADLVILDSPPLLSVADTMVLAGLCDAVLMVCVAGESQRYNVQLARQLLAHVGESIDGVVLNKVGHRAGYGYRGRSRYYYY
jgi:succinoglycan biosynthesis transport protein ExoP